MKKRLLAMLLAVVMVAAFLPTAFAADSEPGIYSSIVLPEKGGTFTLRDWELSEDTSDSDNPYTYTKTESRVVTVNDCLELPLGVTLTIHTYDPFADDEDYDPVDAAPNDAIVIEAWSDPDGDGVYDKRIAANWVLGEDKQDSILPASTEGPVNGYSLSEWFFIDDYNPPEDTDFRLTPSGGDSWWIPSTVQLTSDYLMKLFGANTFIEIDVAMGPEGYAYFHYLLTGKDELETPEEPDETEPPEETEAPEDPGETEPPEETETPEDPEETEPPEEPDETETPNVTFDDVPEGEWYAEAVAWAAENGFIVGSNGKFSPSGNLTRVAIFTILARVDGTKIEGANWKEDAVAWAMAGGVSDGTNPDDNITREQLAAMLYRYANVDTSVSDSVLDDYPDKSSITDWAVEAMAWAVENGLITGTAQGSSVILDPQGTATRAQAALILQRYCENVLETILGQ